MIQTNEVIDFFDRLAPDWDANLVRNESVIALILDNANVSEGKDVLDVACGTGVLIGDYLARGAASVTAIDISGEMARRAREKYEGPRVRILCGDAEAEDFGQRFDCIVVYNAFPHFPEPARLIRRLTSLLKPGGTLTVAHGMSREKIDAHHLGSAQFVSNGLMHAETLAAIFAESLKVTTIIEDDDMYQVAGRLAE